MGTQDLSASSRVFEDKSTRFRDTWGDLKMWVFMVIWTLSFGAVIATIIGSVVWLDAMECRNTAREMRVPQQWHLTTGCLVQTPEGKWIPLENYRLVEEVR